MKKKIYEMLKVKSEEELFEIYSEDAQAVAGREGWMRDVASYFIDPSVLDPLTINTLKVINLRRGCLTEYFIADWNFNIPTIAYK